MLIICDFHKFSFCNMPRARDILSTLPQTLLSRQSLSSWVLIRSTQIFILCLQWENVFINIVWVHINWSDHTDGILVSPLSLPSHLENVFIIRCICLHFPSVYLSVWKIVAIYAIYIQPPRDRQSKNDKTGRKKIHFSNNNKKNRKSAKWYFCNILRATLNQGKVEESVAVKINDCTKQVVDIFLRTPLQRHQDHHHHYNQLISPTPHHHRFDW